LTSIELDVWEVETFNALSNTYIEALGLDNEHELPPLLTEGRAKELRKRYAEMRLATMMRVNK